MAKKKKPTKRKASRKQATRGEQRPIPAWFWLALGLVMGLGLGLYFAFSDFMPRIPEGEKPRPAATTPSTAGVDDLSQDVDDEEWKPQYDFYHVLPEMEVVIPESEIRQRTQRREQNQPKLGPYVLQVGSFRQPEDAERIKAQLALLGLVARVQSVNVDGDTWHRVRVGPYESAREVDQIKRRLQDNRFDVIVLSERG